MTFSSRKKKRENLDENLANAINNMHIEQNNESVLKEWYKKFIETFSDGQELIIGTTSLHALIESAIAIIRELDMEHYVANDGRGARIDEHDVRDIYALTIGRGGVEGEGRDRGREGGDSDDGGDGDNRGDSDSSDGRNKSVSSKWSKSSDSKSNDRWSKISSSNSDNN
ncbi:hypothetical protein C1645_833479 [Glomus cerebriforme]|uniref:Uncharacterized protein n=1 Tax=Glomus cerebriforme TaxID=658196 RepID=A0A397SBJ4_9GLOM|nr:hypothetical protein C1645_833479 [Glomus cerebriforme]